MLPAMHLGHFREGAVNFSDTVNFICGLMNFTCAVVSYFVNTVSGFLYVFLQSCIMFHKFLLF